MKIYAGTLLADGDLVWYDSSRDLRGRVERHTNLRFEVQWEGGNAVWYPLHQMFIVAEDHEPQKKRA